MASIINDLAITSFETIDCFDVRSGEWKYTLDELQNTTIANTQDKLDITGRGGRKLNSIKRNKAVTINGANGLISAGLSESQTGSEFRSEVSHVRVPEYLAVNGNKATLAYAPAGTVGNEIARVYVKNADNTQGTVLTQDSAVAEGKFTYTPATKEIEFNAGELADGTEITVWYDRNVQANVLTNLSDKFSDKVSMYVNALAEDKCNNLFRIQFYIPTADLNGNFEIQLGDAQTIHNFEAESLTSTCHGTSKFWDLIIFGENAPDVVA
jgi:hypothetical protein